jgi:hypothetical protein
MLLYYYVGSDEIAIEMLLTREVGFKSIRNSFTVERIDSNFTSYGKRQVAK